MLLTPTGSCSTEHLLGLWVPQEQFKRLFLSHLNRFPIVGEIRVCWLTAFSVFDMLYHLELIFCFTYTCSISNFFSWHLKCSDKWQRFFSQNNPLYKSSKKFLIQTDPSEAHRTKMKSKRYLLSSNHTKRIKRFQQPSHLI